MNRRPARRFDALVFAVALSLQLSPSMPPASAKPIALDVAWRHYAALVRVGAMTGARVLDAVQAIR